ncbi:hypothetical protein K432DRAFT_405929 [Lepidopterella palustris CBS 459.81]|uniref:Cytochrome P450 n=1 Tax=Lepidopterella palustris CBS 459.81 TaxID=1314670 RepID=A0A8E2E7Z4_9PEZI|nr:hypothetical protein K432DRAFT_405929 [Lepidopterella palustris CBS 459.81]
MGDLYVIRRAEWVSSLWKESVNSSSTKLHSFAFDRLFGMPTQALTWYAEDHSRFATKPHPNSRVRPNNRVDRITHQAPKEFLSGPASAPMSDRFTANIVERFSQLKMDNEWTKITDLLEFFQVEMIPANLEAMYGPAMLAQHPEFCHDFWLFNSSPSFSRRFPRWMIPKAYAARERLLGSIKHRQKYIASHNISMEEGPGCDSDVYWSPSTIKKWHDRFLRMDGFDDDAVASLYLGIIWASNANIVPAVFWMVLELYRCPSLLSKIRLLIAECSSHSFRHAIFSGPQSPQPNEIAKIPLLQSVFADAPSAGSRLRHASLRAQVCDETVWNTRAGEHPLDSFWAERFLIYPTDPRSGPVKRLGQQERSAGKIQASQVDGDAGSSKTERYVSFDGLAGFWIPFGGGL